MTPPLLAPLRQRWQQLAPRERQLVSLGFLVVGVALLWWLALSPAISTWQQSESKQKALELEWQQMLALQTQAQQLQALPSINRAEATRALEAAVRQRLGSAAQLNVQGDRATLTLKGVTGEALSHWLEQVRANARLQPTEARLTRTPAVPPSTAITWDGTLVLNLPTR